MVDHRTPKFRRSKRVRMTIPIEVCGTQENGLIRETTSTSIVNARGALISVAIPLVQGQGGWVTKLKTLKEITGEVDSIGPIADGKRQIAIRFTQRSPPLLGHILAAGRLDCDGAEAASHEVEMKAGVNHLSHIRYRPDIARWEK